MSEPIHNGGVYTTYREFEDFREETREQMSGLRRQLSTLLGAHVAALGLLVANLALQLGGRHP